MILTDVDIKHALDNGLVDAVSVNYDLVNPASLDIRIGLNGMKLIREPFVNKDKYVKDATGNYFDRQRLHLRSEMQEGECWLVETLEYFKFPKDLCGMVRLKSSRGREFYEHLEAGWIDPGYEGRLTLELMNHSYSPKPINPGLRIAQLVLFRVIEPEIAYSGKYSKDVSVQISKDKLG